MKKSAKNILVSCVAVLSLCSFTACDNNAEPISPTQNKSETINVVSETSVPLVSSESSSSSSETETKSDENATTKKETAQYAALDETMPTPFITGVDMGGDENAGFYQPCNRVLDNIPVELMRLRNETEVNNWINSFPSISVAPSNITEYANVYSFITSFNVTKEEAETALSVYLNSNDEQIRITKDEFDTIFSGNVAAISAAFASDYSIVVGQSVYCPNWIYTHTADDYAVAGITTNDIAEKASVYSTFNLTENACAAFENKLSAFTGEPISIEPVGVYANTHYGDEADVADDLMEDVDDEDTVDEVVAEIE